MIRFFKDALREMRHVVWPTQKQTRNFFMLVLGLLVFFTLYLFLFSNIFSTITFGLQDLFGGSTQSQSNPISIETTTPEMSIDSFLSTEELISDEAEVEDTKSGTGTDAAQ